MMTKDKLLHASLSALITLCLSPLLGIGWAVVITAIIGIGKEVIWDYALGKGCPDIADLIADLCGVVVGAVVLICL